MPFPKVPFLGSIVPGEVSKGDSYFYDDFMDVSVSETAYNNAPGSPAKWLKTSVDTNSDGADTAQVADEADAFYDTGGWLKLTKNDNTADLESLQAYGHPFSMIPGRDIYFAARVALADVSETNLVIGLASTDADAYAGMNDFIGFRVDNDGNLDYVVEDDTNETTADTGLDFEDATNKGHAIDLAFWVKYPEGGSPKVRLYAFGGSSTTKSFDSGWIATNLPDDNTGLSPIIENGKGPTSVEEIYVDEILVVQTR